MKKLISKSERFFIAGSRGMAGQAIVKALRSSGYGENEGILLTPSREELNLLNLHEVENWFLANKPTVVILAAANGWIFLGQDYALVIAGVSLGFLWWNWPPARIFLGDVGSIPLGFLLAWLLFGLAAKGFYKKLRLKVLSDFWSPIYEKADGKRKRSSTQTA